MRISDWSSDVCSSDLIWTDYRRKYSWCHYLDTHGGIVAWPYKRMAAVGSSTRATHISTAARLDRRPMNARLRCEHISGGWRLIDKRGLLIRPGLAACHCTRQSICATYVRMTQWRSTCSEQALPNRPATGRA